MGKLEETFNLPDTIEAIDDGAKKITQYFEEDSDNELQERIDLYKTELEDFNIDHAVNMKQYDDEMDEIQSKTLAEFEDLMTIGKDVEMRHAGEIFSAAAQMAKLALDARNNKMTARLKTIELKLRKQRNDQIQQKQNNEFDEPETVKSESLSRDELLDMIRDLKKDIK